jgi:hypothetical protein
MTDSLVHVQAAAQHRRVEIAGLLVTQYYVFRRLTILAVS